MALRYRYRYGFAASISGYFMPAKNKLANPPRMVDPFGGNQMLRQQNTPIDEVRLLASGALLPHFWLGAGQGSAADIAAAQYFAQELQLHLADVPLDFEPAGGHTMGTWHLLIPPMLGWMTNGLAGAVANAKRIALLQAAAASHRKLLAGTAGPKPAADSRGRLAVPILGSFRAARRGAPGP
jgi:hypothetical protein